MKRSFQVSRCVLFSCIAVLSLMEFTGSIYSQTVTTDPPSYGPYNAVFLFDGDGLRKQLGKDDSVLRADSAWSLYFWVQVGEEINSATLIAGIGGLEDEYFRYIGADAGHVFLQAGNDNGIAGPASLSPSSWHLLAATFDGQAFKLFADGTQVASGNLDIGTVSPVLQIAPPVLSGSAWRHFGGKIAGLTLLRNALTPVGSHHTGTPMLLFRRASMMVL